MRKDKEEEEAMVVRVKEYLAAPSWLQDAWNAVSAATAVELKDMVQAVCSRNGSSGPVVRLSERDAVMVGHDAFHLSSSTFLRTVAKNFYTVAEKCANCKLWYNVYIYEFVFMDPFSREELICFTREVEHLSAEKSAVI